MADSKLLIGDIGGTNARFAIADDSEPGFSQTRILQCADFATANDAIRHYLDMVGVDRPDAICIAAAGPLVGGTIRLTNNAWTLSLDGLQNAFGTRQVRLLNDFAAIGYSVPFIGPEYLQAIGDVTPASLDQLHYTIAVLGPGTGLGSVGLRRFGEHLLLINSESAHSGFAPETRRQFEILSVLQDRRERVDSEYLASGTGITNLYWALAQLHGTSSEPRDAAQIFDLAERNADPVAVETVEEFFEILGQVAGDLALTFGAEDGVYVAGGIAQRHADKLFRSRFREGFERKGSHRYLVERIPTQLITYDQPGLLGAAYGALQLVGGSAGQRPVS